jgi:hypothetical protein
MSGGKGKSHGGKTGGKGGAARDGRAQMSHSARAGLQVSPTTPLTFLQACAYDDSFLSVEFVVS